MTKQFEFSDVCSPCSIRFLRPEIPFQEIGSNLSELSSVGAVPLLPQHTGEVGLLHEFHDQLVIGLKSPAVQFDRDSPITIAAFILNTDLLDLIPFCVVFLRYSEVF